jgi:predicted metal-dependent peptidase
MDKEKIKLAKDILMHCRLKVQDKLPFFTMAIYYLTLEADEDIETMATDGYYLYYNPTYVIKQYKDDKNILYICIIHILLHCLLRHFAKKQYTYYELFDVSMDVVVYLMLVELGFITKKAKKDVLTSIPELDEFLRVKKINDSTSIYNAALVDDMLSKALLSNASLFQLDIHDYWTKPKKINGNNRFSGSLSKTWNKMYLEISSILRLGNEIGYDTGNFTQMFISEDCSESQISYEEHLRRLASFDEVLRIDVDNLDVMWYTTGLEMYDDMPIIEFNELKEDYVINEFILAIDTSGSCSGEIMENFLSQTIKIFKDMELKNRRIKAKIIQCDAKIVDERDISCSEDIELYTSNFQAFGFGGTDFNPVFDRIKELQDKGSFLNLKGLIYLSDGEGSFPEEKPPYETIFVLPNNSWTNEYIPEWVTVVKLNE